ncbi:MAG: tRNA lysidine(34) synthetase TilS, partial [Solirubrobacterales bacterium]
SWQPPRRARREQMALDDAAGANGPHDGAAEVREAVRAGGLFGEDRPLVVMLSGGRDSVCLLDVAVSLCGSARVRALHVNYRLREEAGEDQSHCERLCRELDVPLEVVAPERAPGNVQAWARRVRYEAALGLAEQHDALVAVGHTATDQVETILYRLAASPGRRALLGMAPSEGRVVRPLLGVTREQTAAHCVARGLRWREDATNESDAYARGRVRAGLVPALRAVHPAAEANVLRTAELLREETRLLDGLVDAEVTREPAAAGAGSAWIAIDRLAELHPALARLVVIRLAEQAAGPGAYVPQAGDRVAEILALAGRRQGRAELHIGGLVSAVIEEGRLRMVGIAPHFPSPKGN